MMRDFFENQLRGLIEAVVPAHLRSGAARITPSEGRILLALGMAALIVWLVIAPALGLSTLDVVLSPFLWGSLSSIVMGFGHGFPVQPGLSRGSLRTARLFWGLAIATTPIYIFRFLLG